MKKNIIYSLFITSLLLSCTSVRDFSENRDYQNEGFKNFYIVDTIQIEDPVRFFTKNGYEFVMSKRHFDAFKGSERKLFRNNNAFLLERHFPLRAPLYFNKIFDKERDCPPAEKIIVRKRGIQEAAYKINPDFFILMLVNGSYFNANFVKIGTPAIRDKGGQFNFYRVIMPVCGSVNLWCPFNSSPPRCPSCSMAWCSYCFPPNSN